MKKMFTLHELIFVIVITVIGFVSIAAVTERNSKEAALTLCASNMKKLTAAATQYAVDNNNTLPGTTYSVGVNWQLRIAPYLGYKNIRPGWNNKAYPIYRCPLDTAEVPAWVKANAHIAKLSYCANLTLIDFDNADANTDRHKGGRKLDDVAKKDMVILFVENHTPSMNLRYSAAANCYQKGYTYEYSKQKGTLENDDAKIGYHDYKNNWAMLDGHVEYMNFEATITPINRWIINRGNL